MRDIAVKIYNIQLIRFFAVGALNAAFGYLVFAFLLFINLHYSLAVVLSTVMGILFNFKTTGKIVFYNNDNRLIVKFFMVYAVVCTLNIIFIKIFKNYAVSEYVAGFVLLVPMALIAYALNKTFVFKGS